MPGAFPIPITESSAHVSSTSPPPQVNTASAAEVLEYNSINKFDKRQQIVTKTRGQHHLLVQLNALVYILIGYELIKYCHSACLFPFLLHFLLQKMLTPDPITKYPSSSGLVTMMEMGTRQINERNESIENIVRAKQEVTDKILRRTCQVIYWKFIITSLYHLLFLVSWELLIADQGKLADLENGTWWFISFIGESVPQNFDPKESMWYHLFQLGLPGLLFSDGVITFIQLIQFQCMYKQSKVAPVNYKGPEIGYIRAPNDVSLPSESVPIYEDENAVPLVLNVNLYEVFNKEAFLRPLAK